MCLRLIALSLRGRVYKIVHLCTQISRSNVIVELNSRGELAIGWPFKWKAKMCWVEEGINLFPISNRFPSLLHFLRTTISFFHSD